jgi:hypothetical protein
MVFGRNFVTYIIIAFLNTIFGIAQGFMPLVGIFGMIVMIYLGGVSFLVAHRTILQGETIAPGEAFAITSQTKTYFWQYLFVSGIPFIVGIVGVVLMFVAETLPFEITTMALILVGVVTLSYYIVMAFFGTSLVATAVGGDGMMMVSRGRLTFFYSLSRLLILPSSALLAFGAAVYYGLPQDEEAVVALFTQMFSGSFGEALFTILMLSIAMQLMIILFNLITAVIVTKAFLLAEVRLAVSGEPTEWGKQAFGISEQKRQVVYR